MRPEASHGIPHAQRRALAAASVGVTLVAAIIIVYTFSTREAHQASLAAGPALQKPAPLLELLQSGAGAIAVCDIALMNLLCAQGLPGAEDVNHAQCLATLDQWADHIRSETARHLYRYKANPSEFDHSEAYFRMLIMSVVLYEDFGVRYNPDRISAPADIHANDHFFAESRDIFLHGLLDPIRDPQPSTLNPHPRLGTCSAMPVLYVAIGRRLGYPLKLVTTKAHLFLRWDSPNERFDMEATGRGMNRYDDEHFKQWPFPVTEDEIKADGYLKSLTPAEELAVFLSLRGHCLREAGRAQEAASAYRAAAELAPRSRAYRLLLAETLSATLASPLPLDSQPPDLRNSGLPPEMLGRPASHKPDSRAEPVPKLNAPQKEIP
ncbi:MAG TPA: hypothetical protein PKI20_21220 [Verrucomicrobiota bacterium]|nr:hypothetical protein [Verrucomicrobiota bacterium]